MSITFKIQANTLIRSTYNCFKANKLSSSCERMSHIYKSLILKFSNCTLCNHLLGRGICAIVQEPNHALRTAISILFGFKKKFKDYHFNPDQISSEQANKNPILFIHGGFHNQGVWRVFAKAIHVYNEKNREKSLGPCYTLNLKFSLGYHKINPDRINKKVEEILLDYRKHGKDNVEIDIVGYCGGASYSCLLMENHVSYNIAIRKDIRKLICIASDSPSWAVSKPESLKKIRLILAEHDSLILNYPINDIGSLTRIKTGHLGIMYSDQTHQKVLECLSS